MGVESTGLHRRDSIRYIELPPLPALILALRQTPLAKRLRPRITFLAAPPSRRSAPSAFLISLDRLAACAQRRSPVTTNQRLKTCALQRLPNRGGFLGVDE